MEPKRIELPDFQIALSRAVGVLRSEPAWILIHAPLVERDDTEPLHLSDVYGYQLNGLDDGADGGEFLVALLRQVADHIEADNASSEEDPDDAPEWNPEIHGDPPGEEPPPTGGA